MGIMQIQVNEYRCQLCGYRWINRVNGKDGPIPKKCAKCKHQDWNKGRIDPREKHWANAVRKRFGYWHYHNGIFAAIGNWRVARNALRYLEQRPPIEEMKLLLKPMSYLYTYRQTTKSKTWCVPTFPDTKHVDEQATMKAHQYEKQVSLQLLKHFMLQRGIEYNEEETKRITLYWQHGKEATFVMNQIPKACEALKKDIPELSNEDIKTKILETFLESFRYRVKSPKELIEACWPDWIIDRSL